METFYSLEINPFTFRFEERLFVQDLERREVELSGNQLVSQDLEKLSRFRELPMFKI